jgi:hypothetical protein
VVQGAAVQASTMVNVPRRMVLEVSADGHGLFRNHERGAAATPRGSQLILEIEPILQERREVSTAVSVVC